MAAMSFSGTRNPDCPSSIPSGSAPWRVAITGKPHACGFLEHQPLPFLVAFHADAAENKNMRRRHHLPNLRTASCAVQRHIAQPQAVNQSLQIGSQRAIAHDVAGHGPALQSRHGPNQKFMAFNLDEPPDAQDANRLPRSHRSGTKTKFFQVEPDGKELNLRRRAAQFFNATARIATVHRKDVGRGKKLFIQARPLGAEAL